MWIIDHQHLLWGLGVDNQSCVDEIQTIITAILDHVQLIAAIENVQTSWKPAGSFVIRREPKA